MPSGSIHARITRAIMTGGIVVLSGGALLEVVHPAHAIAGALGLVAGHLVTPDLDVDAITHEERRALRVGCLGWAWVAYWWPYAKIMAHRGLSHALLLGTLTRATYLLWPAIALLWQTGWMARLNWGMAILFLGGWALQDAAHIVADWAL